MNWKGTNFNQEKGNRGKKLPTNWKHKLKSESNTLNKIKTWINR